MVAASRGTCPRSTPWKRPSWDRRGPDEGDHPHAAALLHRAARGGGGRRDPGRGPPRPRPAVPRDPLPRDRRAGPDAAPRPLLRQRRGGVRPVAAAPPRRRGRDRARAERRLIPLPMIPPGGKRVPQAVSRAAPPGTTQRKPPGGGLCQMASRKPSCS